MAGVQQLSIPEVTPQALPDVRVQSDATLENFGGGPGLSAETAAIGDVGKAAGDIAQQQYDRANQVAHLQADNAAAQKQTEIQTNVSRMYGQNALQAQDYAQKEWQNFSQDLQKNTKNRDQAMSVMGTLSSRGQEINRFTQTHVAGQMEQFADDQSKAGVQNAVNLAVMNPYDTQNTDSQRARANAILIDQATRKGVYTDPATGEETDTFKSMKSAAVGAFDKTVIQAQLDKDTANGVTAAQAYLEAHKGEMAAPDLLAARGMVEKAETTKLGMDTWSKMNNPGFQLSDGSPDLEKIHNTIMGDPTLGNDRKVALLSYVKAQAREQRYDNMSQDVAAQKEFYNDAITGIKQGVPLSQAMNLVTKYGKDPYTQQQMSNSLQKMYQPPETPPDSNVFLSMFGKNIDGNLTLAEVNKAEAAGQITTAQKISLGEGVLRNQSNPDGSDPDQKLGWTAVKNLAKQRFPGENNPDQQNFLMVMHNTPGVEKMPSEQLIKTANDKLKDAPGTGLFGSSWWMDPQYKIDKAQLDQKNEAWGGVYQNVSQGAVNNVGAGALYMGKTSWGMGDLDNLAKANGYTKMADVKRGEPFANALQTLSDMKYPATDANVKGLLKKYPDGKLPGAR